MKLKNILMATFVLLSVVGFRFTQSTSDSVRRGKQCGSIINNLQICTEAQVRFKVDDYKKRFKFVINNTGGNELSVINTFQLDVFDKDGKKLPFVYAKKLKKRDPHAIIIMGYTSRRFSVPVKPNTSWERSRDLDVRFDFKKGDYRLKIKIGVPCEESGGFCDLILDNVKVEVI